jgi:putative aldouronate transport system substrate-binding protein
MEVGMRDVMKRTVVLVLSLAMLLLMAACAKKGDTAAAETVELAVTGGGEVTYPVSGVNTTVTIARTVDASLTPGGVSSYNDAPGVKSLIEQTGIKVEFIEPVDATALLLYLAGGNLPDVVLGNKIFYPGGITKMHEDGLARDITDLLPRYAPDYWDFIHSNEVYYKAIQELDGNHYMVSGYFRVPNSLNASWIGLVVRKEYLDKLNMSFPETPDELYQFLSRCKKELGVETPFMLNRNNLENMFTGGSLSSGFGLPRQDAYHIGGKVHYGAYEPRFKDLLAWLHKLYEEKLFDNNFAVTDEATAHASVLSGRTALIFTQVTRMQVLTFAANYAPDFTLAALPSMTTAKGVLPMYSYADHPATMDNNCFLTEKNKDVENTLKLLNYAFTEKGNILVNFGQEGKTFTYVNGEPVFTDFVLKNPDGLTLDGILRAYGILNFPIVQDERMTRQRFPLASQIEAMEKWSNADNSKYRIINTNILTEYVDEYAALVTDINTFIAESRAQFISGALSLDRFDSYYIPTLKSMGMDRLLEILQLSYDAYNR